MPKVQFSDVVPPEKRSIRNVPIPNSGKRKQASPVKDVAEKESFEIPPPVRPTPPPISSPKMSNLISEMEEKRSSSSGPYEYYYPKDKEKKPSSAPSGRGKKQTIFLVSSVVVIAAFIFGMMTIFASAKIYIKQKSQNFGISAQIKASVEKVDDGVRYEVLKLSKSKMTPVQAGGEEMAEVKAHGKIIVYNNFSSEPQRLIIRTRFESPDGLIFRIPESIVVPGKTVSAPGSIEVEVFADEAGDKYNIKKTDFTVPGFKNDAERYKGFYARSVDDMSGGFIGKRKTVLPKDREAALSTVDAELKELLDKELQTKVPEGLALLPGSIWYESTELPQEEVSSAVSVGKEVTGYALLLNRRELSDRIVSEYVSGLPDWKDIKSSISDFSSIKITKMPDKITPGEPLNLQIDGEAKVLADIDANSVSQKLSGRPKGEAELLMEEYTGITGLKVNLKPRWKMSFPSDPAKITIEFET